MSTTYRTETAFVRVSFPAIYGLDETGEISARGPQEPLEGLHTIEDMHQTDMVVRCPDFQPNDLFFRAFACEQLRLLDGRTEPSRVPTYILGRQAISDYVITDLAGELALVVREDVMKKQPRQYMTPRLSAIMRFIDAGELAQFNVTYLKEAAEHL